MFMAMKREVQRLGGCAQEFFVSQTRELTAMADAVIDLDAIAAGNALATGRGARAQVLRRATVDGISRPPEAESSRPSLRGSFPNQSSGL